MSQRKNTFVLSCYAAWRKSRPQVGTWNMFYARLHRLMGLYQGRKDEVGRLVRHLRDEMNSLWLFLQEKGVDATNNLAERNLRFAVLWRKRSFGTRVDKGIVLWNAPSPCAKPAVSKKKRTFPVLVEGMTAFLQGRNPELQWIPALAQPTP